MSVDVVDDLHGAEDHIDRMRSHAQSTLDVAAEMTPAQKVAYFASRLSDLVYIGGDYCRPSCEDYGDGEWSCGPDCGCPGEHGPGHAQDLDT